jgi:hypothetical protein
VAVAVILLVSGGTPTVRRMPPERVGVLFEPARWGRPDPLGRAWAADNGCYSGFDEARFLRMLGRLQGVPGCLFVASPDVVGLAEETLALFDVWEPRLRALGFPVALVAQDGLTPERVPWGRAEALFVGGTTEFKLGASARGLVAEAKRRGLWAHMGRVNSCRRIRYAARIGVDSVDGTAYSRNPEVKLAVALRCLRAVDAQPMLWEGGCIR